MSEIKVNRCPKKTEAQTDNIKIIVEAKALNVDDSITYYKTTIIDTVRKATWEQISVTKELLEAFLEGFRAGCAISNNKYIATPPIPFT